MSRYHSPNPSLLLFKGTWHLAFLQRLLADGQWSNTKLPVEFTGPRWAQCWQRRTSLSWEECPWKFTLCCFWLATPSPSPKPACSGLQEWELPSGCSDPPPCRTFLLARVAPRRGVDTGRECSCMNVLGSCPAWWGWWHFPSPFSATVFVGDAEIWWLAG